MAKKVNTKANKSGAISLGLIIPLCIFIAPVGVLLQVLRQKEINRHDMIKAGRSLLILTGVYLLLFFILVSDPTTVGNPFTYSCLGGGIVGLIPGIMFIREGILINKIIDAVGTQKLWKVSEIAIAAGAADHEIMKLLITVLKQGNFPDLELDMSSNMLRQNEATIVKIMLESRAVECENCGAKVTVFKDKINKCEYCGSSLNYEK
jgi:hypothetical protein